MGMRKATHLFRGMRLNLYLQELVKNIQEFPVSSLVERFYSKNTKALTIESPPFHVGSIFIFINVYSLSLKEIPRPVQHMWVRNECRADVFKYHIV